MKIAYHMPSLSSIYAQRTIYNGFRNAFLDLGYGFFTFTAGDDLEDFLEKNQPDIFLTASHFYYQKFLNLGVLEKYRKRGMVVFVKLDYWNSPIKKTQINEPGGMKDDRKTVELIRKGKLGDVFFHVVEQEDGRMKGFYEATGKKWQTIPLAADKILMKNSFDKKFVSDIAFVGTYLPAKRKFFEEFVFPLGKKYNLKLYGQDWTKKDRILGFFQKVGQYFNIPFLRTLQKPKLQLEDEAKIYSSAKVCINVHEDYQKSFGGDCNERTFKIPLCEGFEISDYVPCMSKYFEIGKEIITVKDKEEWFSKIDYYLDNPQEKASIIEAGKKKVLEKHTYHNRVKQIIQIYADFKKN